MLGNHGAARGVQLQKFSKDIDLGSHSKKQPVGHGWTHSMRASAHIRLGVLYGKLLYISRVFVGLGQQARRDALYLLSEPVLVPVPAPLYQYQYR